MIGQLIIPMSGFGERFRAQGYTSPKPLINIAGRPMIEHVLDMYPTELDVLFIVNQDHLRNPAYQMEQTLYDLRPSAKIHAIKAHKTGPSGAISMARKSINTEVPVVVNYCDFTCLWDFWSFWDQLNECDGVIATYTGFHPHMLRNSKYAFVRQQNNRITEIREKTPFTNTPMLEPASSGTYGFKSGKVLIDALDEQIRRDINLNGEFYTSLTYVPLLENEKEITIFNIDRFFQWGTPEDLEDFNQVFKTFENISDSSIQEKVDESVVLLAAGLGSRFSKTGYTHSKPSLPVNGSQAWKTIIEGFQNTGENIVVTRPGLIDEQSSLKSIRFLDLEEPTQGQAVTAKFGLALLKDESKRVTIASCDAYFPAGISPDIDAEVIVWTSHPSQKNKQTPEQFAWVKVDDFNRITEFLMKTKPENPAEWQVITGTYTFLDKATASRCIEQLIESDIRTNGEIYLDNLLLFTMASGRKVLSLVRPDFVGLGTPEEYESFRYWQGTFHRWKHSAYSISDDLNIPADFKKLIVEQSLKPLDTPLIFVTSGKHA